MYLDNLLSILYVGKKFYLTKISQIEIGTGTGFKVKAWAGVRVKAWAGVRV